MMLQSNEKKEKGEASITLKIGLISNYGTPTLTAGH